MKPEYSESESETAASGCGAKERLIVALDVPSAEQALGLARQLGGRIGMFKIGSQLYAAEGPALVRELVAAGEKVFLDLKLHDIPEVVRAAVRSLCRLGISMLTVHSLGGAEMISRAREAIDELGFDQKPLLLSVTLLTSLDSRALRRLGIRTAHEKLVLGLARAAMEAGADGLVASAREAKLLRRSLKRAAVIVAPGIRPEGTEAHDQKRTATPREAILAGVDYLVVGRPITRADDPVSAAEAIIKEIEEALG